MARSVALPSGSSQRVNTDEGHNMRRLFTKDGVALRFWFDGHIPHTHVERLTTLITKHGGVVRSTEAGSDVIIVSENYRQIYDQAYWSYPDVYVELPSFIQDCIERKKCEHMAPIRKGMGGQPKPRRPRTEFTAEDRRHLCDYLARVIPDKADGGRTGNIIYQRLVASAEGRDEDHINAWAKRHTWQSWREHYKKNQLELDPIIDEIAPKYPPKHRGQYELSRRAGPRKRVHHEVFDGGEEEEEEEPAGNRSRRSVSPQQSGGGAPLYEKEEEEEEDQDQQDEDQDEYQQDEDQNEYQQKIHGGKDLEMDEDEGEEDGDQRILRDLLAFDEDDQIPETSDDDPIWKAERRRPDQNDEDSMGEDEEDSDAEHPSPVYSDRDPQSVSDKLARNRRNRAAVAASSPTRFAPSQVTLVNTTQSGRTQASNGRTNSDIIPEDLEPVTSGIIAPPRARPKKKRRIEVISPGTFNDPPARNTRAGSRSRSVEPTQPSASRRVDKGKQKATMAPVEEAHEESDEVVNLLSEPDYNHDSDDERSHEQLFPEGAQINRASGRQGTRSTSVRNPGNSSSYKPPPGTKAAGVRSSQRNR